MPGDRAETVSSHHAAANFAAAALITIDVQRDTLDGGPLEIPGTTAALRPIGLLAETFRRAGRPIVHIVRLYRPDGGNVDLCRRAAVRDGLRVLTPGTPGSQPAAELLSDPSVTIDAEVLLTGGIQHLGPAEVAIYKPRWGAFYDTPLDAHLRRLQVTTLIFCGCNFPDCPRTSIYEASERDYRIVLATDATSGIYERCEDELAAIGVHLMRSADIAQTLRAAAEQSPHERQPEREGAS